MVHTATVQQYAARQSYTLLCVGPFEHAARQSYMLRVGPFEHAARQSYMLRVGPFEHMTLRTVRGVLGAWQA
jgi:hypothetical protein